MAEASPAEVTVWVRGGEGKAGSDRKKTAYLQRFENIIDESAEGRVFLPILCDFPCGGMQSRRTLLFFHLQP